MRGRLRVNGSRVGLVVPMLVARWRQETFLQCDDLVGAGGDDPTNDECPARGEVIGEGFPHSWILGRCVEPTNLSQVLSLLPLLAGVSVAYVWR